MAAQTNHVHIIELKMAGMKIYEMIKQMNVCRKNIFGKCFMKSKPSHQIQLQKETFQLVQ